MTAQQPTVGTQTRIGFGTVNPVTQELEFSVFGLAAKPSQITTDGVRGTRSRPSETVTGGLIKIDGRYEFMPTPSQLAFLLQYILGGTPTGSSPVSYTLAETMPTGLYCQVDRGIKVYTYTNVIVARAEFSSQEGDGNAETLKVALDLMATSESEGNSGTFPVIHSTLPTDQPFTHYGSTLTANTVARNVFDVRTVIDNHAEPRYLNSQTPVNFRYLDRTVTVEARLPFTTDEHDLFVQALQPGVAGSLAYVSGAKTLTFTFGALQAAIPTPEIHGRTEVQLPVPFVARTLGDVLASGARELVVTM